MPNNGSADPRPRALDRAAVKADVDFRRRRSAAIVRSRGWAWRATAATAAVLVLAAAGTVLGRQPNQDRLQDDAAAMGEVSERGGSQCPGWPAELTISTQPSAVAPDRVMVFLSQQGWHVAVGDGLAADGVVIQLAGTDAAFRASDKRVGPLEVEAADLDTAELTTEAPAPPSDRPTFTTRCTARAVTFEVLDGTGRPLPGDVISYADGTGPGTNPATFERA